MTTPLKALLQERLRAKIVRQGDDEGSGPTDTYGGSFPGSLSNTAPLIDPSEYMVPPPFTDNVTEPMGSRSYANNHQDESYAEDDDVQQHHYGSELKYARRRPAHHQEQHSGYRQYDEYSVRPSRKAVVARQSSPVKVKRSKRSWHAEEEDRHFSMGRQTTNQDEEAPMYSAKRARVVEKPRHRHRNDDGYASVSPSRRKNYDLSGAYQRYREISSKREQSRQPEPHTGHHDLPAASWSKPPHREFTHARRYYEDEYDVPEYPRDRTEHWKSPERTTRNLHDNYDPKEDSVPLSAHQHRRLGDVHPVGHVAPPHPIVVSPTSISMKRRTFSPVTSRGYSNQFQYHGHIDTSSDRLVFPAALHIPGVPRSPTVHFHRSPDSSDESPPESLRRFRACDNVLSPESRQAAKDFVEKRQKRSTQGTPRTMATHRWLQSMMEARRNTSAITTADAPQMASEDNGDGSSSYYPAAVESSSTNTGQFLTGSDDTASNRPTGDQFAAESRSESLTSLQQPPAFYSPRMYSSGCFFEAEI